MFFQCAATKFSAAGMESNTICLRGPVFKLTVLQVALAQGAWRCHDSSFKVLISDWCKNHSKFQTTKNFFGLVCELHYPSLLRSQSHYITKCGWYLLQTETPGKHSQPSKAIFQPLISGIKSLHVSLSQLCSYLNGMWLLQGINQRRWLIFTSKSSVKTDRLSGRGQWSE